MLAGGGIKGGQVIGDTGADGAAVEDRPVVGAGPPGDRLPGAGHRPEKQNLSNVGRPIRIVDPGAKPVQEVLA